MRNARLAGVAVGLRVLAGLLAACGAKGTAPGPAGGAAAAASDPFAGRAQGQLAKLKNCQPTP